MTHRRHRWTTTAFAAALFVAGCSHGDDAPGAVSADEAAQLNDAAAMLDANSVDVNAVEGEAAAGKVDSANEGIAQ